jgi:hypothetical protein
MVALLLVFYLLFLYIKSCGKLLIFPTGGCAERRFPGPARERAGGRGNGGGGFHRVEVGRSRTRWRRAQGCGSAPGRQTPTMTGMVGSATVQEEAEGQVARTVWIRYGEDVRGKESRRCRNATSSRVFIACIRRQETEAQTV